MQISGDNSEEVTPVPIPNTVVKLLSADDTWRAAAWESRTLPVSVKKNDSLNRSFFSRVATSETGQQSSEADCRLRNGE